MPVPHLMQQHKAISHPADCSHLCRKPLGVVRAHPRLSGSKNLQKHPREQGMMEESIYKKSRVLHSPPDTAVTQKTEWFWKPWLKQVSGWFPGTANYHQEFLLNTNSPFLILGKNIFNKKSEVFSWGNGEAERRQVKYFPSCTPYDTLSSALKCTERNTIITLKSTSGENDLLK